MRAAEEIYNQFTREKVEQLQEILIAGSSDEKIEAAMQFLNIDPKTFSYIPFKADKLNFLHYKFVLTHFELCKQHFQGNFWDSQGSYWDVLNQLDGLTEIARDVILNSSVVTEHKDIYCQHANGLRFLFHRTGKVSRMDEKETKDRRASIMQTGKKPGGIEPGFMAEHQQDLIQIIVEHCPTENIHGFVQMYLGNIEAVYNHFVNLMPKYMYKMDYHTDAKTLEHPGKTPVYLTEDDVMRTNNIKKAYDLNPSLGYIAAKLVVMAKNSTSGAINEDAVLETLANDLVSTIMQVQNQALFRTEYPNLDLKIMPSCEWVKNARSYGKEGSPISKEKPLEAAKPLCEEKDIPLFGGLGESDNYRVRHLVVPQNGITALSDNRILNASQYYLPLLFTGDYDKIGSKGQNMLVVPHACDPMTGFQHFDLVGIDFGHTLKEKNRLIADITFDGRFIQPTKNPFKNFTALSDGSLSERIQGMILLSKLLGYRIHDDIIASYGDAFYIKYHELAPNVSNILCDNYIHAFKQLCVIDESHASMYEQLIESITAFKMRMNEDLNDYLSKFEPYLQLDANQVDFIDNINKFSAAVLGKTQLTSNNTQVGLHHLCMDLSYRDHWILSFDENTQYYTCKYTGKDPSTLAKLAQAFNNQAINSAAIKDNTLQLSFYKNGFAKIQESFQETTIKKLFHPREFEAIQKAKIDIAMQDLVHAPWFKKYHMELSLKAHPTKPGHYELVISFGKATTNLRGIIKRNFEKLPHKSEHYKITYDFDSKALADVYALLAKIQSQNETLLKNPGQSIEHVSSISMFSKNTAYASSNNTNSNYANNEENPIILFKSSIEIICAIMVENRTKDAYQNNAFSNLSNSLYSSVATLYNSKQNPNSSAALLSKLNDYLTKCNFVSLIEHSTLFDEVLAALQNRLSYVEAQLSPNASETMKATYEEEIFLLKDVIAIGDKIENADSKLAILSNSQ